MDLDEHEKEAVENEDPDKRISIMAADKAIHRDNEFYDSAEEDGVGLHMQASGTKGVKDAQSYRGQPKRARTDEAAKAGDSSKSESAMEVEESGVSLTHCLFEYKAVLFNHLNTFLVLVQEASKPEASGDKESAPAAPDAPAPSS